MAESTIFISRAGADLREGLGEQTESLALEMLSVSCLLDIHMLVLRSQLKFKSGVQRSGLSWRLRWGRCSYLGGLKARIYVIAWGERTKRREKARGFEPTLHCGGQGDEAGRASETEVAGVRWGKYPERRVLWRTESGCQGRRSP